MDPEEPAPSLAERLTSAALRLGPKAPALVELLSQPGTELEMTLASSAPQLIASLEALAAQLPSAGEVDGVSLLRFGPVLSQADQGLVEPLEQMVVASWNLKGFGSKHWTCDMYSRVLEQMGGCDVVAIQELTGTVANAVEESHEVRYAHDAPNDPWLHFLHLCASSGFDWVVPREKTGYHENEYGERSIIFFSTMAFKCAAAGYIAQHKWVPGNVPSFHRTPYAALFLTGNASAPAFWVVNVHYSVTEGQNPAAVHRAAVLRRREMELTKMWCETMGQWPCIVCGDMNTDDKIDSLAVFGPRFQPSDRFFNIDANMHVTNASTSKPNRFDHIMVPDVFEVGDFWRHKLNDLSDHRMICAVISLELSNAELGHMMQDPEWCGSLIEERPALFLGNGVRPTTLRAQLREALDKWPHLREKLRAAATLARIDADAHRMLWAASQ